MDRTAKIRIQKEGKNRTVLSFALAQHSVIPVQKGKKQTRVRIICEKQGKRLDPFKDYYTYICPFMRVLISLHASPVPKRGAGGISGKPSL